MSNVTEMSLEEIADKLKAIIEDEELSMASEWKRNNPDRPLVGFLPAYMPRELIWAAGGLAVGVWGASKVEIVHGDAYFQSYICHIPRSVIELASKGCFKQFDGMVFPSICDVIRNLSGMWKMLHDEQWVKYLDLPQNLDMELGGHFYQSEMRSLAALILGREPDDEYKERLREAIKLGNRQQAAFNRLFSARNAAPHLFPMDDYYGLCRSSLVLEPEEHIALIDRYLELAEQRDRRAMDSIRVVVMGAFCEQPPMGVLRTIEGAGCYIVDHDFMIGLHWFTEPLDEDGDPFESLARGFLQQTRPAAFKYQPDGLRGQSLLERVRSAGADGVIFAAPSFCDPSLLDQPMLTDALDEAGVPYTAFKYAENTGQYQSIREQAGTFSDSIRLWG